MTVTDEQIAEALVFTAERMKLVLEPRVLQEWLRECLDSVISSRRSW